MTHLFDIVPWVDILWEIEDQCNLKKFVVGENRPEMDLKWNPELFPPHTS